ncbi:zinc finger SWIM domain-containing protein 7 isoform X1 [Tripterygium wilfordii]|uniref:zinc finger SWIM domain-containing protein 7 isoform X1 n=1 Tax=Tripterygium wilfordii TaxID=458696 RepID=UPI0018F825B4|nr:zinc finger SWIM domain-containing protein 7 isoform X1 [Tripterygium wilfordii]
MSASSLVAETVWKSIDSSRSGTVTEEQLSIEMHSLNFLFGKNFERATKIVDQRGVKKISGEPSGRSVFQVVGESRRKEEYLCFPEHYCACYSFFYDIVNRGEQLSCKHQLAARLAASLGICIEVKVPDEQLAQLLSTI